MQDGRDCGLSHPNQQRSSAKVLPFILPAPAVSGTLCAAAHFNSPVSVFIDKQSLTHTGVILYKAGYFNKTTSVQSVRQQNGQ
jgi:hypothetical protein